MNIEKLTCAIRGQTVIVTWQEVGIDYNNNNGFSSYADLQSWCTAFGLTITEITQNGNPAYQISKTN